MWIKPNWSSNNWVRFACQYGSTWDKCLHFREHRKNLFSKALLKWTRYCVEWTYCWWSDFLWFSIQSPNLHIGYSWCPLYYNHAAQPNISILMIAGGVVVNDYPKIQCKDPTSSDHCISFESNYLKITLKLSETFSYFYSWLLHVKYLHKCNKIFITTDSEDWNLHCKYFDKN